MADYTQTLRRMSGALQDKKVLQEEGSVAWSSPSNIAIVKYWGKYPDQVPANASLSMTLKESVSNTRMHYRYDPAIKGPALTFRFDNRENKSFESRISSYLESLIEYLPWLRYVELDIRSENTFPHSSGIASSASAMSSIAMGLCSVEEKLYGTQDENDLLRKASFLARLGSGSASRSIYGNMSIWGQTTASPDSSNEYAIPVHDLHEEFQGMKDSILLIETGKKAVSSSLGHDLMKSNPYAETRFRSAEQSMQELSEMLKTGNFRRFIDIMENEALSLHAMMMTSNPGFILMKPNTLAAIQYIREYREKTGNQLGFTLDAGANVHIVYPQKEANAIRTFINKELAMLCVDQRILHDEMGAGPKKIPVE